MGGHFVTSEKLLTRRGVLWLGQTCNLRCHFCFFLDRIEDHEHPEHAFMDLAKATSICHELRSHYGNTAVDIQGGEPTVWRDIDALVSYCRDIGLAPTLITNAIVLARRSRCERLQAAGLSDLKISVQGLGRTYDDVVGYPGGSVKQLQAIEHCRDLGIPFRFNCALTVPVLAQLTDIAHLAVAAGALAVNFLTLQPFQDQATGHRSSENVPRYLDVGAAVSRAIDVLEAAGIEANVRYLPLCMVEEPYRKHLYNMQQLPYDHHEWDFDSWSWTGLQAQMMKPGGVTPHHESLATVTYRSRFFAATAPPRPTVGGAARKAARRALAPFPRVAAVARRAYHAVAARRPSGPRGTGPDAGGYGVTDELGRNPVVYRDHAKVRAFDHTGYTYVPQCAACDVREICDGYHVDYPALFGTGEARAVTVGQVVVDPLYYIGAQRKVHEPAEAGRPYRVTEPFMPVGVQAGPLATSPVDGNATPPPGDANGPVPVRLGVTRRRAGDGEGG